MPIVLKIDSMQNKAYDLSDLESHGKVVDVSTSMVSPFKQQEFELALMRSIGATGFDPETDYLAIVGRVVNCTFAAMILLKHFGQANLLIYSSIENRYVPRTFTLSSHEPQASSLRAS